MSRIAWLFGLWLWLWGVFVPVQAEVTLPQPPVPILDLAGQLNESQRAALAKTVSALETDTGFKVRVLTQKLDRPGNAVRRYWNLDERSIVVVMSVLENNPLDFSVGLGVRETLPRVFWQELQGRYGNVFYIQENGRSKALSEAVKAIDTSIRQGGRASVPGLPREHWLFTFVLSICGGLVAGFASHGREEKEKIFNWKGFAISSPLWFILFVAFGLGPVLVRTSDWLPVLQNFGGFLGGAIVGFLIPSPKREGARPNPSGG